MIEQQPILDDIQTLAEAKHWFPPHHGYPEVTHSARMTRLSENGQGRAKTMWFGHAATCIQATKKIRSLRLSLLQRFPHSFGLTEQLFRPL